MLHIRPPEKFKEKLKTKQKPCKLHELGRIQVIGERQVSKKQKDFCNSMSSSSIFTPKKVNRMPFTLSRGPLFQSNEKLYFKNTEQGANLGAQSVTEEAAR